MPLNADNRLRAAAALKEQLTLTHRQLPAVQITESQWRAFTDRLRGLPETLHQATGMVHQAAQSDDFHTIRDTSEQVARVIRRVNDLVAAASMFDHPAQTRLARFHAEVGRLGNAWLEDLTAERPGARTDASTEALADARTALARLAADDAPQADPDLDPWQEALGVERHNLADAEGRFSTALLVAQFHGRLDQLYRQLHAMFVGFNPFHMDVYKLANFASAVLDSDDPIETVNTSQHIRALINQRFEVAPDATIATLRDLIEGIDRSYANSVMMNDLQRRLARTDRRDKRSMMLLDLYRRMAEGQVKPWAWTLVRLHTGASGPPPTLAQIGDRLRAVEGDDLASLFATCIAPSSRNAAAHEDYHWDARRGLLIAGEDQINPDLLQIQAIRGYRLMAGCELGWALACGDQPLLESAINTSSGDVPTILAMQTALIRFAHNNLTPMGWELDGDELTMTVDRLTFDTINPCAQAILEASASVTGLERINVRTAEPDQLVMTATSGVLASMLPRWFETQRWYQAMPPAVFLPILFESRLLVEEPEIAVNAAKYFALNEAVHFLEDFHERRYGPPGPQALTKLAYGLHLAESALRACADALPNQADELMGRAHRAIKGAGRYAAIAANPTQVGAGAGRDALKAMLRLGSKIVDLHDASAPCAVLPTLDPTPLGG